MSSNKYPHRDGPTMENLPTTPYPEEAHVHCNGDGDGLCCALHMDGNPDRVVHPPALPGTSKP